MENIYSQNKVNYRNYTIKQNGFEQYPTYSNMLKLLSLITAYSSSGETVVCQAIDTRNLVMWCMETYAKQHNNMLYYSLLDCYEHGYDITNAQRRVKNYITHMEQ
jgi:hypothetical protein